MDQGQRDMQYPEIKSGYATNQINCLSSLPVPRLLIPEGAGSEEQIGYARTRLDSIRTVISAGNIGFLQAAKRFDESKNARYGQFFLLNAYGSTSLSLGELDREIALAVTNLRQGEYSAPFITRDEEGRTIVRMIYLQSRSEPHIMNLKDDYDRIAAAALEQKRALVMAKWLQEKIRAYAILVDPEFALVCKGLPLPVADY